MSQNPSHVFSTAEAHTVALTAGNSRGTDETSQVVVVLPGITPSTPFPIKVSANGRYLVDQNDVPFFMVGDAPQALIVNASVSEADLYLANRAAHGFNVVWVNLLCASGTGGRGDASTFDGLVPFAATGDFSSPNEAYFARCDEIINAAAGRGITVILDPAECISFLSVMLANGVDKCRAYGRYLGNRYKGFDNIIWMSGNDFWTWRESSDDAVVKAVAVGIKETDSRHIHTALLDTTSTSLDNLNWRDVVTLNAAYTYMPTYGEVLKGYNMTPAVPVFLGEADYEFERGSDPERLRRQEYWTYLAGGCGHLYGNGYVWPMIDGWKDNLDSIGATQIGYCKALFQSRAWYALVPDQAHALVIAGYGTFYSGGEAHSSISENDYVTAAATPDGQLALAYVPSARSVTVDLTRLSGTMIARWYDPTTGSYQAVAGSPFPNTAVHAFSTPGLHADGSSDWILVLEKQ
jgi:PKD repeat protein